MLATFRCCTSQQLKNKPSNTYQRFSGWCTDLKTHPRENCSTVL